MKRVRGFTLVEILVALVVLASVTIVLADTIGAGAVAHTRLEDSTRAWQVAADKLVELQVYQGWPAVGNQDEIVERNGTRWQVRTRVSSGPYADTRRVDIEVGEWREGQPRQVAWSLFSLIGQPFNAAGNNTGGAGGPGSASGNGNFGAGTEAGPPGNPGASGEGETP